MAVSGHSSRLAPVEACERAAVPRSAARHACEPWLGAALLALAAGVRIFGLTSGGIWLDEGYSLLQSERSLAEVLGLLSYDANPPLYTIVLHLWRSVFGPSEVAAKSLSALAGVIGVAAVWRVARARFGMWAGLIAGLLVALSRFHVNYSQEIRGYALLFAFVAAADLFFVRWETRGAWRDLVGWAAAGWAAVMTHYFAWWVLGIHALLATRRRAAFAAAGAVFLASAWMLLPFGRHLTTFQTQSWIPRPDLAALLHLLWVLGGCGRVALLVWGLAALALAVPFLPLLPATLSRDAFLPGWRTAAVPGLHLTLPCVLFAVSVLVMPMLVERYVLISLVPLACLAGAGVTALRPLAARVLVVAALALLSIPPLLQHYAQESRSGARQELSDLLLVEYRPGDVVLYTSKWTFAPFVALHPREMEEYLLPALEGDEYSSILLYYTSRRVRRDPPAPGEYRRLWLVLRAEDRPEDIASADWFRKLRPEVAWEHPSGLLVRFDLPR